MEIRRVAGRLCRTPICDTHRPRIDIVHHWKFRRIGLVRQLLIKQLYKDAGYDGAPSNEDMLVVAAFRGRPVGVLRIVEEQGEGSDESDLVLRGMFVHERFRNQGIGSRMLAHLVGVLIQHRAGRQCFCVVTKTRRLLRFYKKAGFRPVRSSKLPAFLQERAREYTEKWGRPHAVLCRS